MPSPAWKIAGAAVVGIASAINAALSKVNTAAGGETYPPPRRTSDTSDKHDRDS